MNNNYWNYLEHSSGPWKKHKYIKKDGDKYYYPESYKDGKYAMPKNLLDKASKAVKNTKNDLLDKASKTAEKTKNDIKNKTNENAKNLNKMKNDSKEMYNKIVNQGKTAVDKFMKKRRDNYRNRKNQEEIRKANMIKEIHDVQDKNRNRQNADMIQKDGHAYHLAQTERLDRHDLHKNFTKMIDKEKHVENRTWKKRALAKAPKYISSKANKLIDKAINNISDTETGKKLQKFKKDFDRKENNKKEINKAKKMVKFYKAQDKLRNISNSMFIKNNMHPMYDYDLTDWKRQKGYRKPRSY